MDPIRYVNIASYATGPEAHMVRNELEAAGIPAQVIGEAAVGAIWYVGSALGGVKIMVAEKDVPAATKILAELELLSSPIDESFDGFDDNDQEDGQHEVHADAASDAPVDPNPYRSPRALADDRLETGSHDDAEADEALANRIWRSAVFGVVFCPPLMNFYSVFQLLANVDLFQRISPKHKWKLWGAVVFNGFVIGMVTLMAWTIYFAVNAPPPYMPAGTEPITIEKTWNWGPPPVPE
jgi:hypothetical protein